MAHIPLMMPSDDDESSQVTTSFSTTMDSSVEDIKPDLTLLGQVVSAPPSHTTTVEEEDSCEEDPFSPQPGGSAQEPEKSKRAKKGSKKGGMKGLKQGAAGDDSFTISTLSAGRGQKKLQAAHLTSSLLEEVLNEKKMALLRSPEVVEKLQMLQEDVKVNRQQGTQQKPSPSRQGNRPKGHQDREARSSHQRHPETPSVRQENQCTTSGGIWSKEGSAFTSVTSMTASGSNTDT